MQVSTRARIGAGGSLPEFESTILSARRVRNVYDAGANTNRTSRWMAPTSTPNAGILSNLRTLRDRSRAAVRNDGYAKGAIGKLVTNLVGTGIKPLCQATDPRFRRDVHTLWNRWTDESDADGLLDFYGQESQAVRGWLEGGEQLIRLRPRLLSDGLSVPLQLQVIEPELCPHDYDVPFLGNGNRIRAGIEFNAIGKRVAYHLHASRPGDWQDYDTSTLVRVPASAIIHLYDPLRAGQLRGLPELTQALIKLYELDKFDDATLLRQQLANMFVGFITQEATSSDVAVTDPLTGGDVDEDDDLPMIPLTPGLFQKLDPGQQVKFSDPPAVSQTYPDFMRQQLYAVSAATDVPYETLTGDLSRVNDRTVRVVLSEFRRRIMARQHQIVAFQFCRRVYAAWFERAWLSGALAVPAGYLDNPAAYTAVKWMPQGWPYLQPVQDVQAARDGIRDGLTTRSAEVAERGEDAEAIDAEQAADNERADRLGLRYDSDGRHPMSGAAAAAPPPADTDPSNAGTGAAV